MTVNSEIIHGLKERIKELEYRISLYRQARKLTQEKKDYIRNLITLNSWRRGADIKQPDPVMIGNTIDLAIKLLQK